jgi:hypothetical protein
VGEAGFWRRRHFGGRFGGCDWELMRGDTSRPSVGCGEVRRAHASANAYEVKLAK